MQPKETKRNSKDAHDVLIEDEGFNHNGFQSASESKKSSHDHPEFPISEVNTHNLEHDQIGRPSPFDQYSAGCSESTPRQGIKITNKSSPQLTEDPYLRESTSLADVQRGRDSLFFDNQAEVSGVSELRAAKRPKSFSPRANFQFPAHPDKASARSDCQWLSSKSAARYLDSTEGAIRNMVWRGQLTAYKLPNGRLRFKKSELDRQLESSRKQGGFNGR